MELKVLMGSDTVKERLHEILGKNASTFATTVIQVVSANDMLKKADPVSVLNAAMMSATLKLPVNPNLGMAYILPYNDKTKGTIAQFQIGYKGFLQLAQRSGQFKNINVCQVFENDTDDTVRDRLTKIISPKPTSNKIIGYAGYFSLINGFEKSLYMSVEELEAHGIKYSQSFKKGYGLWKDNFDAMALKTVIKLLLSKYAPLSIEMERAVLTDQSYIKDVDSMEYTHIDNKTISIEETNNQKQRDRYIEYIKNASSEDIFNIPEEDVIMYDLSDIIKERIKEI